MMKLFRAIHILVWLPFAILANLAVHIAFCSFVLWTKPNGIFIAFVVCGLIRHIAQRIEVRLRPRKAFGPAKLKPLVAGLVKAASKGKAPSPGKAAFTRGLSPQLKQLLKRPANQKPMAMRYEEEKRVAAQSDASAGAS